jgi:hypothetical protein
MDSGYADDHELVDVRPITIRLNEYGNQLTVSVPEDCTLKEKCETAALALNTLNEHEVKELLRANRLFKMVHIVREEKDV